MVELVTKFYSLTLLSILLLGAGFFLILNAVTYKYDRMEVITSVSLGIFINILVVYNYIVYIRKSLQDLNQEIREEEKRRTIKIGEILELIIFTIMILTPLWRIPYLIDIYENKKEFTIEIIKVCVISIAALFLLYNLNPMNIKEKIKQHFIKKDLLDKDKKEKIEQNQKEDDDKKEEVE